MVRSSISATLAAEAEVIEGKYTVELFKEGGEGAGIERVQRQPADRAWALRSAPHRRPRPAGDVVRPRTGHPAE